MYSEQKKPLYRKANRTARGARHSGKGGEYKWSRNAKADNQDALRQGSMRSNLRHGLDYSPLFKFLLSRVGQDWDETYREAVARLDQPDPIFWMVARSESEERPRVRVGENAYFSGLYIDADNRLARVDPDLSLDDLEPSCACCTHTFNGEKFTRAFRENWPASD